MSSALGNIIDIDDICDPIRNLYTSFEFNTYYIIST